ncbi:hypothetical protein HJFPF1_01278 [Paramyrothecium foliicola]|nr:hypothetical protein HJFPF1_01278 [Paramyrothecium foliicola]
MAFWVGGGARPLDRSVTDPYFEGGKRRVSFSEDSDHFTDVGGFSKRARLEYWDSPILPYAGFDDFGTGGTPFDEPPLPKLPAFLIIREHSPTPEPANSEAACCMERTVSGLSISSDTSQHSCADEEEFMLGDLAAADLVRRHVSSFQRRYPDSKHERILKALINPKSRAAEFPLDNDALQSIFYSANELFFANKLSQRVDWDWSHESSSQYESHIVGTTALRRSARLGGYETLIVLSSPILKDTKYNRRLLISTFLHEMIHSFLFINCGLKARHCGGHTEGFRQIAEIIDDWAGRDYLRLSDMEADLERFREDDVPHGQPACLTYPDERAWDGNGYTNRLLHPRYSVTNHWHWYEREGFSANSYYAGGPPYV